jgi:alkanesulfonate monooxygenase SsuD/methylene tetrahydromethanopterin reductase-like flavin-dependent oxidoreductase (luciferase family)
VARQAVERTRGADRRDGDSAALDPGEAARAQLASQLAVYLGAPGYGEAFAALGFGELVDAARAGTRRAELVAAIPLDLAAQVAAAGRADEIAARIAAYHDAGADHVAVAPSTAEDTAGRAVLEAVARHAVVRAS